MRVVLTILLVALFAGCTSVGDDEPQSTRAGALTGAQLETHQFYLFQHDGGPIKISATNTTEIELFNPEDERLGLIQVGTVLSGNDFETGELNAGAYVLRLLQQNGNWTIGSDQAIAEFYPLVSHTQRYVLAQAPKELDPTLGLFPTGEFVDNVTSVDARPAHTYRLYSDGAFTFLQVTVRDNGALALFAEHGSSFDSFPFTGARLNELGADTPADGMQNGKLSIHTVAEDLQGSIILETETYSRIIPVPFEVSGVEAATLYPFQITAQPTRFEADGNVLAFISPDDALLTLFGPEDERVATLALEASVGQSVAIQGGEYVAVSSGPEVTMKSDRLPADFQQRQVNVQVHEVTFSGSGQPGTYQQWETQVEGNIYQAYPFIKGSNTNPLDCNDRGLLQWGYEGDLFGSTEMSIVATQSLLQDRPLAVKLSGFTGQTCGGEWGLEVYTYSR